MPVVDGSWVPELYGKQWMVFNSYARALLVSGPRLSGKCLTGEAIVYAGDRLTRMRRFGPSVKPGEYLLHRQPVLAFDQDKRQFVNAFTCGFYRDKSREALKFTVKGRYDITTSLIHPLWSSVDGVEDYRPAQELNALQSSGKTVFLPIVLAFDGWSSVDYRTVTFLPHDKTKRKRFERNQRIDGARRSLPVGGLHAIAAMAGTTYHTVKAHLDRPSKVRKISVLIDEDLGYLIGALIGDGCVTPKNVAKNRIGFSSLDKEAVSLVNFALGKHFGSQLTFQSGCDWTTSCPLVRGLMEALGLVAYAHEKKIPDELIESPKSVVRALLQGLFDTDGTADKHGRVSFCSTSEVLARDVQRLLLAFGMASSIGVKKTDCRDAYTVDLYGDSSAFFSTIGFRIVRKQNRRALVSKRHFRRQDEYIQKKYWLSDGQRSQISMGGKVMWRRVISCENATCDLYDVTVPVHHSFVANGFINHNTWGVLHKIVRHMWETPNARVAMFTKVLKNSKDAGAWKSLHEYTLPEWIKANIGLKYTTKGYNDEPGPKVDGQTRTPFFRLTNAHGGESECMLFSLDNDAEAEAKLKEKQFSLIYFSELSNFGDRMILSMALLCLRSPHLSYGQQQFIADTNPAEEGESSWIYEAWFIERNFTYEEYAERQKKLGRPVMKEPSFLNFKAGLSVIEIMPKDNPKLEPQQLEELEATYSYDPGLYARYVLGKWVYGEGDASRHFRKFFKQNAHVRGDCSDDDEARWDYINPSPNCFEIITGLDTGDVNHAAVALERTFLPIYVPKTNSMVLRAHFSVLDEHVTLNTPVSLEVFAGDFTDLIEDLEELQGRKYNLDRCYSDSSALNYSATADSYPAAEIQAGSRNRLVLIGVPKPKFSVRLRVQLVQQLLAHERIKVSAHCFHVIRMLRDLKKGKGAANFILQSDDNRHVFDALSYALLMECAEELEKLNSGNVGARQGLAVSIR